MADREIDQLIEAAEVKPQDLFVMRQDGSPKKLRGETLERWLLQMADGHGGIASLEQTGTVGLDMQYRITFADGSTFDYTVRNGRSVSGITQFFAVSNSGTTVPAVFSPEYQEPTPQNRYVWGFTRYDFDDGSTLETAKMLVSIYGDTGLQTYVHIRWANRADPRSIDISSVPDEYIGIYSGLSQTAPTAAEAYKWYKYKGETGSTGAKGDPGETFATVVNYGASGSTTEYPANWYSSITSVPLSAGSFQWTRAQYVDANNNVVATAYSVSHIGRDGTGAGSVNSVTFGGTTYYDTAGDVSIPMPSSGDIGAIAEPASKGDGQFLQWDSGANEWVAATPTGSVTTVNGKGVTAGTTNIQLTQNDIGVISNFNGIVNPWFTVNQRGQTTYSGEGYTVDRWVATWTGDGTTTVLPGGGIRIARPYYNAHIRQILDTDVVEMIRGKTVTVSMIVENGNAGFDLTSTNADGTVAFSFVGGGTGLVSITAQVPSSVGVQTYIHINNESGNPVDIKAVKLELGSVSTLANDAPPDYATELQKCMRYFQSIGAGQTIYAGHNGTVYLSGSFRVPMRVTPAYAGAKTGYCNFWGLELGGGNIVSHNVTGWTFSGNDSSPYGVGYLELARNSELGLQDGHIYSCNTDIVFFTADL